MKTTTAVLATLSALMTFVIWTPAQGASHTVKPKPTKVSSWMDYNGWGLFRQCDNHNLIYTWIGTAGVAIAIKAQGC